MFRYTHWANLTLLDVLEQNQVTDADIIKLMSHVVNA